MKVKYFVSFRRVASHNQFTIAKKKKHLASPVVSFSFFENSLSDCRLCNTIFDQ